MTTSTTLYPPWIEALGDRAEADRVFAETLLGREACRDVAGRLLLSEPAAEALDRARASSAEWADAVSSFHRRLDATGSGQLH